MTPDEYQELDAVAIDALVSRGEVSSAELAAAAQRRHEQTHPEINAVVEWYSDPTPPQAVADDAPALRGVPILRKDYGSAEAGRLVEMGSRIAQGQRATETSPFIGHLQAAGAQIVGRSAVPEFIQHGVTGSRVHGLTRNPWNTNLSPGGSSGGAAAAVAAGVVPIAHASDCAGSIRIPAATCGLVGLKPGRDRVPMTNDWNGIAQEFVVTRSVRDARRCLEILGTGEYRPVPGQVRCAVSTSHWAGAPVDADAVEAVKRVAQLLRAESHMTQDIPQPVDYELLMRSWPTSFSHFALVDAQRLSDLTGRPMDETTLEPMTLAVIEDVRNLSAQEREDGYRARTESVTALEVALTGFDVIVTPTLGRPTLPLAGLGGEATPEEYFDRNDEFFPYNYLFNLSGWPSISVPAGLTGDGHPVGVQISGPIGSELLLLQLADLITAEMGGQTPQLGNAD